MNFSKFRIIFVGFIVFVLGSAPVIAGQFDPTGLWESEDKESRYELSLCGDGTQLCAKLVWIRPDVTTARNMVYINTYVVNQAKKKTEREWRGNISLYGMSVSGRVKVLSMDQMLVLGCALLVLCERQLLNRMAVVD